MIQAFSNFYQFVRSNSSRFFWEVVSILISYGLGFLISHLLNRATLESCQDERAVLLRQYAEAEVLRASRKWETELRAKDSLIQQLQHDKINLRERMALDSATRLNELETMRSINARYPKR